MNPVDASCTAAAKESSALQAGSKCMNYRGAKIGKPKEKGKSCRIGKPVCQLMKKNEHLFIDPGDAFSNVVTTVVDLQPKKILWRP